MVSPCFRIQLVFFPSYSPRFLTDDDAPDGSGPLNVSGLLCKHALAPLQQGDAALNELAVGQLSTATVGLRHRHKASHLRREREKGRTC